MVRYRTLLSKMLQIVKVHKSVGDDKPTRILSLIVQARHGTISDYPEYTVVRSGGPDERPEFTASVSYLGTSAVAIGSSKQSAKETSAEIMIKKLKQMDKLEGLPTSLNALVEKTSTMLDLRSLLLRCGDVELNPGPPLITIADSVRLLVPSILPGPFVNSLTIPFGGGSDYNGREMVIVGQIQINADTTNINSGNYDITAEIFYPEGTITPTVAYRYATNGTATPPMGVFRFRQPLIGVTDDNFVLEIRIQGVGPVLLGAIRWVATFSFQVWDLADWALINDATVKSGITPVWVTNYKPTDPGATEVALARSRSVSACREPERPEHVYRLTALSTPTTGSSCSFVRLADGEKLFYEDMDFERYVDHVSYVDPPIDLTMCGDVERNPGPGTDYTQVGDALLNHPGYHLDNKVGNTFAPVVRSRGSKTSKQIDVASTDLPEDVGFSWLVDRINHTAGFSGNIGLTFHVVGRLLEIPLSPNRYTPLEDCMSGDEYAEPTIETSAIEAKRTVQRFKKFEREQEYAARKGTAPRVVKPIQSEEDKKQQYIRVIDRIANKFKNETSTGKTVGLIGWLDRPMSQRFRLDVCNKIFGEGWMLKDDFDPFEWYAYCKVNAVSKNEKARTALKVDKKYEDYCKTPWFTSHFGADEADASLHNKVMHAYNGNPVSRSQKENDALPDVIEVVKPTGQVLPRFDPRELRAVIQFQKSSRPGQLYNVGTTDRIRANAIANNNAITIEATLQIPTTSLIARTVRPATGLPGALVNSTARLPGTLCGLSDYYGRPLQPTELTQTISQAIASIKASTWRGDSQTISGFHVFDVASIAAATAVKGLSMESDLIKMVLFHSVLGYGRKGYQIPMHVWRVADPYTTVGEDDATLGNASPVFGETCIQGGIMVFPFLGVSGTVRFHTCLESVPERNRDQAYFMPTALMNATENQAEAIALFVMSKAPYPFCLYTATKVSTDVSGATNPQNQVWTTTNSLVSVPGPTEIDIILPRKVPSRAPTTTDQANYIVLQRPVWGPVAVVPPAVAVQPPNTILTVNAVGPAVVSYELCAYLISWGLSFDQTTIRNYLNRLNGVVGVSDDLYSCREIAAALSHWCQPLVSGVDANTLPTVNTYNKYIRPNGFLMDVGTVNWPTPNIQYSDYTVNLTDALAWNKVALGVATVEGYSPEGMEGLPEYLANPNCILDESLLALSMAAAYTTFYGSQGLSSRCWTDGFTNTEHDELSDYVPKFYATTGTNGQLMPAKATGMIHELFKHMFERQMTYVESSNPISGQEIKYTVFDRWLPPLRYGNVVDPLYAIDYIGNTPVIVTDLWLNVLSLKSVKACSSFPPPNSDDSLQGYFEGLDTWVGTGVIRYTSPYLDRETMVSYFDVDDLPYVSDRTVYNTRIFVNSGLSSTRDAAGNVVADACIPAGQYAFQAKIWGGTLPPLQLQISTLTSACMSPTGLRQYQMIPQANVINILNAMNRQNYLSVSAWAIGDVTGRSNVQRLGAKKKSIWMTRVEENMKSGFGSGASLETPAPPPAAAQDVPSEAVLAMAVEPTSTGNSSVPLSTMVTQGTTGLMS
ncbi:hypothetical protein 1 [Wuhan insect virus 31]|uniref:DRBM domain-containing protein n=1 Tax=Wuhan insect virus 31 TaxID=1923735 RepID=A0A1L3KFB3_9VIRU|nr:hypothetical protein 1 [Wuhan insect virus 31]APG76055.1 hypothetical protein 1 [Wuhan insect virus 31]